MILFDSSPETIAETLQSDVEIAAALPEENFRTQSAEALVETGGSTDEAKSLIKVIRDRAGNTNDIDKMVAERYNGSLRDLVRNERRVELAQEGLRFADIRRWNILLDVMNKPIEGIEYRDFSSGTPKHTVLIPAERDAYTAKDFWWPIPQAEIDLNPGRITQNEGWK